MGPDLRRGDDIFILFISFGTVIPAQAGIQCFMYFFFKVPLLWRGARRAGWSFVFLSLGAQLYHLQKIAERGKIYGVQKKNNCRIQWDDCLRYDIQKFNPRFLHFLTPTLCRI